jgi:hypothetical protein
MAMELRGQGAAHGINVPKLLRKAVSLGTRAELMPRQARDDGVKNKRHEQSRTS